MEFKAPMYGWAGLGITILICALYCGAWWHLTTATLCGLMSYITGRQARRDQDNKNI